MSSPGEGSQSAAGVGSSTEPESLYTATPGIEMMCKKKFNRSMQVMVVFDYAADVDCLAISRD